MTGAPQPDDRPHLIAVNRFYWPDHSATGQLLADVCEHAAANGFRVTVLASRMRYDAAAARLPVRETRRGVDIRRVWSTRLGRGSMPGRVLDCLSYILSAFATLLVLARRGDVVLVKTDPPLISVPAALAARLRGARLVNWLQDVFPEAAGALGVGCAAGPAGALLRFLRDRSLAAAHANVAVCDRMAERVRARRPREARVRVIPNWPDAGISPVPRDANPLRAEWGLTGRFVIGYSGNLGRAHRAAEVVELIRRTAGIDAVTWLFIGGGAGRAAVEAAAGAAALGVPVVFRDYQPRERLADSLSVPDLHLVSLDPACEGLLMPSKLYGAMAAGRGVLALGDPDGAVAREVRRGGFGIALDIAAPEAWAAQAARVCRPEVAADLGARARAHYAAEHLSAPPIDAWLDTLRDAARADLRAFKPAAVAP